MATIAVVWVSGNALAQRSADDELSATVVIQARLGSEPLGTTVSGRILWQGGSVPSARVKAYADDSFCGTDGFLEVPLMSVDPATHGVAGALVSVNPPPRNLRDTSNSEYLRYEFRFADCLLAPRVRVVPTESRVEIVSRDFVQHECVVTNPDGAHIWDHTYGVSGDRAYFRPRVEGMYEVRCKRHAWERAWIKVERVVSSAVSDQAGQFWIHGLPPGSYGLRVWHPPVSLNELKDNGRVAGYEPGDPVEAAKGVNVRYDVPASPDLTLKSPAD